MRTLRRVYDIGGSLYYPADQNRAPVADAPGIYIVDENENVRMGERERKKGDERREVERKNEIWTSFYENSGKLITINQALFFDLKGRGLERDFLDRKRLYTYTWGERCWCLYVRLYRNIVVDTNPSTRHLCFHADNHKKRNMTEWRTKRSENYFYFIHRNKLRINREATLAFFLLKDQFDYT